MRRKNLYMTISLTVCTLMKSFFLTEENMRFYRTTDEQQEAPKRVCAHKLHILKVMFLAAVARPCFDDNGQCIFDGKIGIWPFIEKVPAKRTSN
jgi:hypothetical protein